MARSRLRAQGGDRRQLRALRPAPARPPRRGAGRVRYATTSARSRTPSRYAAHDGHPRHRLRGADAVRHGRAHAGRHPAQRLAPARVRPGRRARARHGVPRAAACSRTRRNESFVRHRFVEGRQLDELLAPPRRRRPPGARTGRSAAADRPGAPRRRTSPSRCREWRRAAARASFAAAVDAVGTTASVLDVPAVIDGERVRHGVVDRRRRPRPVRSTSWRGRAACDAADADAAVAAAVEQVERWRATPTAERAACAVPRRRVDARPPQRARRPSRCSRRASRGTRPTPTCARPSTSVSTTAARCCASTARPRYGAVASRAKRNRLTYQGKGVAVVIAPWNFPLAIPCGMTAAALVAGNPTILKPAEQTPAMAWQLVEAFAAAGLPRRRAAVPSRLWRRRRCPAGRAPRRRHHRLHRVEGGRAPHQRGRRDHAAGQRHVKRVIAEMGGKNALVIDSDADLDQAVPAQ